MMRSTPILSSRKKILVAAGARRETVLGCSSQEDNSTSSWEGGKEGAVLVQISQRLTFLTELSYVFYGQLLLLFSSPINILPVSKSAEENKLPLKHTNKTTIRNNNRKTGLAKRKRKMKLNTLPCPIPWVST